MRVYLAFVLVLVAAVTSSPYKGYPQAQQASITKSQWASLNPDLQAKTVKMAIPEHKDLKVIKVILELLVLLGLKELQAKMAILEHKVPKVIQELLVLLALLDHEDLQAQTAKMAILERKDLKVIQDLMVLQGLRVRTVHVDHQENKVRYLALPDLKDQSARLAIMELQVKRVLQVLLVSQAKMVLMELQVMQDHQASKVPLAKMALRDLLASKAQPDLKVNPELPVTLVVLGQQGLWDLQDLQASRVSHITPKLLLLLLSNTVKPLIITRPCTAKQTFWFQQQTIRDNLHFLCHIIILVLID
ncbi:hypothetical protein GHT06_021033 [Daphnia sinensis]|uniref:Uncharacterized protein n=1 Tax=Daphnia sinensis TaxID=1820382 RepID=A0AAD5PS64_9CRUS|nr:hypothetical protein GHT06_021033 [Daphnia sinensis]